MSETLRNPAASGPLAHTGLPGLSRLPELPGLSGLSGLSDPPPSGHGQAKPAPHLERRLLRGASARPRRAWSRGRLARLVAHSGRTGLAYLKLAALALTLPLLVPFVFAAVIAAGWTLLSAIW